MTDRIDLLELVKRAVLPASMLALVAYFLFHAVAGNTGLLAWRDYRAEHETLKAQAAQVAQQREALERQNRLLDPRHVNPDFADELVRRNLGVVGRDEATIDLSPPSAH